MNNVRKEIERELERADERILEIERKTRGLEYVIRGLREALAIVDRIRNADLVPDPDVSPTTPEEEKPLYGDKRSGFFDDLSEEVFE